MSILMGVDAVDFAKRINGQQGPSYSKVQQKCYTDALRQDLGVNLLL